MWKPSREPAHVHYRAHTTLFSEAVILISQDIRCLAVVIPFCLRLAILMHGYPFILSRAEIPSDEGFCQSFPGLYLCWIRSVYGFALVLTELFFFTH